jgi:hypothetical protein
MDNIYQKIKSIQTKVSVRKGGKNPHFKSDYIKLEDLIEVVDPLLHDKDLLIVNMSSKDGIETRIVDCGTQEFVASFFPLSSQDPQKVGAAFSYGRRYNLCNLLNVISDRDTDAEDAKALVKDASLFSECLHLIGTIKQPDFNHEAALKALNDNKDNLIRLEQMKTKLKLLK